MTRLGVAILVGGASSRMGADKAALRWGGVRAVDRCAGLGRELGAAETVTAGGDYGMASVADPTPQAGPVAGLLAAARWLEARGCSHILALAVDAPTLTAQDIAPLISVLAGATYAGFPLPMFAPIASLDRAARTDWPLRRLVERAGLAQLACSQVLATHLRGANTPQERDALVRVAGLGHD